MNDLDERLREDFAELTRNSHLDLGLHTADVIRSGRRRRALNSARLALGGAAVVVVAAMLAWAGLSPLRIAPVVPAAPAPSFGELTDSAYFDLSDLGLDRNLDKVQVDAEPAGTGWDVTITTSRRDGLLTSRIGFRQDAMPGSVNIGRVIVQFLPTRANWWNVAMKERSPALVYSDSMHVGGLALTAIVAVQDKSARGSDIAGFVWADADGQIRDSLGSQVPSTEVAVGERSVTLYWDSALDLLGYQSPNGQHGSAGFEGSEGIYPRFLGTVKGESGPTTELLGDILPEGAHDLQIVLRDGEARWGSAELAGRLVYAVSQPSASSSQPIRSISYLAADGTMVSLDLP